MDLVDLDLCVILPVTALDSWVRADLTTRGQWLAGDAPFSVLGVAGQSGVVFRRQLPRPTKALQVLEPRKKVAVVISGADATVRAAIDAPDRRVVIADAMKINGSLLVMGGDLAHADIAGGTPVAGPHRMVDLAPSTYRVELRSVGEPGDPGFASAIVFE